MTTRSDLLAALATIDAELAAAEQRVTDLRLERRGAEALLRRLGVSVDADRRPDVDRQPAALPTRTVGSGNAEQIAAMLAESPQGMTLSALKSLSAERGQVLDYDQVRSAVTYLKKKGRAERVGRGEWRLVEASQPPTNTESAAGTALSVVPVTDPEKGGEADGTRDHRDHYPDQEHRDHSGGAPAVGG
jgi:hypothetical protein